MFSVDNTIFKQKDWVGKEFKHEKGVITVSARHGLDTYGIKWTDGKGNEQYQVVKEKMLEKLESLCPGA